ncbi:MAG: 50S ribosomal protein L13 [Clostridiales bacterium]|jgi:large subunit ribosomal protein L13|nr:50S ribosomal protein L13 [Clostridiales bacterium]
MSTYMANEKAIERKWYVLDAAGKPLGHTAATAAMLLRGKHKPEFTPHVDTGDFVIVINSDQAVLTGKKSDQKFYRTHSGYVGGLKEVKYRILMEEKSDFAMTIAVRGMLPSNHIGRTALSRLKVFKGSEHIHEAQKPEVWAEQKA